jgi:Zn-dependent protease
MFGDDTAKRAGRISLNPLSHYDPIGSTFMLLFGFGWAKPVPINPNKMRNPRLDGLLVSLWGPLTNILFAAVLAIVYRLAPHMPDVLAEITILAILINLTLAFFNLVPLPPLDGSHIITYILPREAANAYLRFMSRYGFLMILVILFLGQGILGRWIQFAVNLVAGHLIGGGN